MSEPVCVNEGCARRIIFCGWNRRSKAEKPLKRLVFDQEQVWGIRPEKCTADNGVGTSIKTRYSACHPDRKSRNRKNTACAGGRVVADRGSWEF